VTVTEDTTREDLVQALAFLCVEAKAMSRRGLIGTLSPEYARRHEQINAALDELLPA
jgi:hypothetical protein